MQQKNGHRASSVPAHQLTPSLIEKTSLATTGSCISERNSATRPPQPHLNSQVADDADTVVVVVVVVVVGRQLAGLRSEPLRD